MYIILLFMEKSTIEISDVGGPGYVNERITQDWCKGFKEGYNSFEYRP